MADQHLHCKQHAVSRQGEAFRKGIGGGHSVRTQTSHQCDGSDDGGTGDYHQLQEIHELRG